MTVNVRIRYFGIYCHETGVREETVTIESCKIPTLDTLWDRLKNQYGDDAFDDAAIIMNSVAIPQSQLINTTIPDNSIVQMLPALSGG